MEGQTGTLSRRNSVRSGTGSRRPSVEMESGGDQQTNVFGQMKPLKKSKPVSTVKITFMGKPMVGDYYCFGDLFELISRFWGLKCSKYLAEKC